MLGGEVGGLPAIARGAMFKNGARIFWGLAASLSARFWSGFGGRDPRTYAGKLPIIDCYGGELTLSPLYLPIDAVPLAFACYLAC